MRRQAGDCRYPSRSCAPSFVLDIPVPSASLLPLSACFFPPSEPHRYILFICIAYSACDLAIFFFSWDKLASEGGQRFLHFTSPVESCAGATLTMSVCFSNSEEFLLHTGSGFSVHEQEEGDSLKL